MPVAQAQLAQSAQGQTEVHSALRAHQLSFTGSFTGSFHRRPAGPTEWHRCGRAHPGRTVIATSASQHRICNRTPKALSQGLCAGAPQPHHLGRPAVGSGQRGSVRTGVQYRPTDGVPAHQQQQHGGDGYGRYGNGSVNGRSREVEERAAEMFLAEIGEVDPGHTGGYSSGEGEGGNGAARGRRDFKGEAMGLVGGEAHLGKGAALTSALAFLSDSQSSLVDHGHTQGHLQTRAHSSQGEAHLGQGEGQGHLGARDFAGHGPNGTHIPGVSGETGSGEGGEEDTEGAGGGEGSPFSWATDLMTQITSRVSDLEQGLKEREVRASVRTSYSHW